MLFSEHALAEHTMYLPVILNRPCAVSESAGVSWMYFPNQNELKRLCGSWYYHMSGWRNLDSYVSSGGIPVMWCDYDRWGNDYYDIARDVLTESYDGTILVLNEPDRWDQCDRNAYESAVIVHTFLELLPHAKLIFPNIVHMESLAPFLDTYYGLYGEYPVPYRWGMHNYTTYRSAEEEINIFCSVLESRGIECNNIWITEYGSCNPDLVYEKTRDIISSDRVEKFAVFTNRDGGCYTMIDDSNNLTDIGEAYIRAMTE